LRNNLQKIKEGNANDPRLEALEFMSWKHPKNGFESLKHTKKYNMNIKENFAS